MALREQKKNTVLGTSVKSKWRAMRGIQIHGVGALPAIGAKLNIHEFDYAKNQTIYEENGVVIKSFPAVHQFDGPVSFRLSGMDCPLFTQVTLPQAKFLSIMQKMLML